MKNGIITPEDGNTLLEIYHSFDLYGNQKRPLTTEEQVLIFVIGKAIKEEKIISKDGANK